MKERPILFSAPMVKAILDGRKTVTRRVCKPAQFYSLSSVVEVPDPMEHGQVYNGSQFGDEEGDVQFSSPYGGRGDRLWLREAWMPDPPCDGTWGYTAWAGCRLGQIAGVPERFRKPEFCNYRATWQHKEDGMRWTPGIHMPRWASRITLEVTGVRIERLQDISEADAAAEGIQEVVDAGVNHDGTPRDAYRALWASINGPGSWDANPWVWVVEFKRLEAAA